MLFGKATDAIWGDLFFTPLHTTFECLSARPSVSASFPDSNLSICLPTFFKLCMAIDFEKEWFGIINWLISLIHNIVMVLD